MKFRHIFSCFTFWLIVANVFSQETHLKVFPDKYRIDLPAEWKKPKLIEAITTMLPVAVSELKDKMFCTECKAGYTVRLIIESPEIVSENIQDQSAIKKKVNYLYTQTYRFRAALGIYDSLENVAVEFLLVDPQTVYTFKKEFTVPVLTYVSVVQDQQGKIVKQTYGTTEKLTPFNYVSDHKQEFSPRIYDLMAIAEQKVFEIKALIDKLSN